jgi:hypothetical protein|tara:strand:- start:9478 stop:9606 length:129 start_codon:yes stop_codon:yes gene_type:complete
MPITWKKLSQQIQKMEQGKYQNDLTKIRIEIARLDGLIDWLE